MGYNFPVWILIPVAIGTGTKEDWAKLAHIFAAIWKRNTTKEWGKGQRQEATHDCSKVGEIDDAAYLTERTQKISLK